ncbi:hypothetical protein [Streptomyces sp. NPDC029554]|uniref:hypothetical protein n=1 Tax=Streptomyces sp. NPDC029554 TaxID=3155126 RepID=UPI0033E53B57
MSKPFEYSDGATGGGLPGAPNVYVPQGAPPPEYDAYADPAAAHGWQDVYGGTAAAGGEGRPGTGERWDGEGRPNGADSDGRADSEGRADAGGPVGGQDRVGGVRDTRELVAVPARARSGGGHRTPRKPPVWRTRRVAVAAGAAGVVSAAALIAGFSFSGTSSDGTGDGKGGPTAPTVVGETPTASASARVRASTPGAPLEGGPTDQGPASGTGSSAPSAPSAPASPTPSAGGGTGAPESPAGSPTAGTATPSASVTATPPGRADGKPGHGPGGTKGPK